MSRSHDSEPPPGDFVVDMSESSPPQPLLAPQQRRQPEGDGISSSESSALPPTILQGEDNDATKEVISQEGGTEISTSSAPKIGAPNHENHAVSFRVPNRPPAAKVKREEKDEKKATKLKSTDKNDGWPKVYNEYKSVDEEWTKKKNDHIDTLLVFAGLFSAVLTAFLVQVYTELHPDNAQVTQLSILLDISNQLHAISLNQIAQASTGSFSYMPTDPSKSLVATTSLWFISLILSLGSAFFGILVKQWLREYMAWTEIPTAHDAVHVRQYRHNDLKSWRVETIVMIISECLQLGLVLFFLGLATLLWEIDRTVAVVATISVGVVLLLAATTAVLPALLLSCPYRGRISFILAWALWDAPAHISHALIRTSIGIAAIPTAIRNGALTYLRDVLIYFPRTVINAIAATLKTLRNGIWFQIDYANHVLLRWREMLQGYPDSVPRVEDHRNWIDMDLSLRLPKKDGNENLKRVLDMCTSLFWLISHRDVPNPQNLVQQCLSDLQAPGITLELFRNSQGGPQAGSRTYDSGANPYRKLEFDVYCQVLLGSIKSNYSGPDMLKDCDDLQEYISRVLPYRVIDRDSKSNTGTVTASGGTSIQVYTLPWYAFDDESITLLSDAIQNADRKSHGAISAYFILLASKLLDPQVFFSQELTLVAPLFRILFLFWYCSEYYWKQRYQGPDVSDADPSMEPQRQSYHYLRQAFTRLLAQPQQIESAEGHQNHQDHYDTIVDVLAFGIPVGFLSMLGAPVSNGCTVKNIMKSAIRFAEYYERELSPSTNLYEGNYALNDRVGRITNLFWSSSNLIVLSDNREHLDIPDEDHREFLTAMQKVLEAELEASVGGYLEDYDILYILRHRSHLPGGFVSTLKKMVEGGYLDILMALDVAEDFFKQVEGGQRDQLGSFWTAFESPGDSQAVPEVTKSGI